MKLGYFILVFLLGCVGCNPKSTEDTIKINISNERVGHMSDYFQKAKIIPFETNDSALIANINKIILAQNRMFASGNSFSSVFIFDSVGKHISTIKASGRGPGEFVMLGDMAVDYDKNELILLASVPRKLMFFDWEGKLKREFNLDDKFNFNNIVVDESQILAKYTPLRDSCVGLSLWNEEKMNFEILDKTTMIQRWRCPVVIEGFYMIKGDQVNWVKDFDRKLYTYSDGTIKARYELDFGADNFVYEWMDKMNYIEFVSKTFGGTYVFRLQNVKEVADYIFFNTNNGKGLGIIDKRQKQGVLYQKMRDDQLQLTIEEMKPVEDHQNEYMGTVWNVSSLKKNINKAVNRLEVPEEFADQLNALSEDSNPVLFLYKCKE